MALSFKTEQFPDGWALCRGSFSGHDAYGASCDLRLNDRLNDSLFVCCGVGLGLDVVGVCSRAALPLTNQAHVSFEGAGSQATWV